MLFIPKDKIEGNTFNGSPLSLKQVRLANPNISIPEITMKEMTTLEKVVSDLGYEIVPGVTKEALMPLIGDTLKEKKLTVTSCTREDGKWTRNFKAEKISGNDLARYRGELRAKRNELLAQSDWTQISDAPLSQEKKSEWKVYRQELRDLTKKYDHPIWCKYPTAPKGDK